MKNYEAPFCCQQAPLEQIVRSNLLFVEKSLFYLLIEIRNYPWLKLQSCKLYNNKYLIVSTQITNTDIFAFIAAVDFKLMSRKKLFKTAKTIKTVKTQVTF